MENLKDKVIENLKSLGLEIVETKDTNPKGFKVTVLTKEEPTDLNKLQSFVGLVFDGYGVIGKNVFELVYYIKE